MTRPTPGVGVAVMTGNRYRQGARGTRRYIAWRIIVNSYPCPVCPAGPGQACITEYGNPKQEPHAGRAARAHGRGWAAADQPARCFTCNGPLPNGPDTGPRRCPKCVRRDAPRAPHATADNPGPDGSYDVPLWGEPE